MDGLQSEDVLILGAALIMVLNRTFTGTSLKLRRPAYVALQIVNLATVAALLRFRLEGYPAQLDLSVRVFLMFVVAWHMVLANQGRAVALRRIVDERREQERKVDDRERRMQQLAEWDEEAAEARASDADPPA